LLTIFFANENDTKKFSCEYWISLGYLIEGGKRTRKKAKKNNNNNNNKKKQQNKQHQQNSRE